MIPHEAGTLRVMVRRKGSRSQGITNERGKKSEDESNIDPTYLERVLKALAEPPGWHSIVASVIWPDARGGFDTVLGQQVAPATSCSRWRRGWCLGRCPSITRICNRGRVLLLLVAGLRRRRGCGRDGPASP